MTFGETVRGEDVAQDPWRSRTPLPSELVAKIVVKSKEGLRTRVMSPTRASWESSTPIWPKKPLSHTSGLSRSDANKIIVSVQAAASALHPLAALASNDLTIGVRLWPPRRWPLLTPCGLRFGIQVGIAVEQVKTVAMTTGGQGTLQGPGLPSTFSARNYSAIMCGRQGHLKKAQMERHL
jgi:hypothetical protein